jgi:glutathione peroxidase
MSKFSFEDFKKMTYQDDSEKVLSSVEQQQLTELLGAYDFKVAIIVNTASNCGFTKQYAGLQELYTKFKDQGLIIVAQPCNQFMGQEPGTDSEIKSFCELNYNVSFPLLEKADVVSDTATDLYKTLFDISRISPRWNFHKYIFSKNSNKLLSKCHFSEINDNFIAEIESMLS